MEKITEGATVYGRFGLMRDSRASPNWLGGEEPARISPPGRPRLGTELAGCGVAGGIARILPQLLAG